MKRKLLLVFGILLCITGSLLAQNRTIKGKVTSADDASVVPGAIVQVKGTTVASQTDSNGEYSISAGPGQTLVFSFIGFASLEEVVGNRTEINAALVADMKSLDEIIVSGVAGATSRKKMTVSVTKVTADQLTQVPATSLSSALTGKVAGLKTSSSSGAPGSSVDLLLRGDNVLNVSSSPLILIDGIIMNGSLADINVDDVESMEVIKGAAASALYGSRAGGGVISITSKRGKSGSFSAPQINVRNEVGFQTLQHLLETAESHPYALASDWQTVQGQYTKYAGVTYPAGYTGSGYNSGIAGNRNIDADHYLDNPFGVYRNPAEDVFQTGLSYTNYISFSNRTERNNVFLSFENNKQGGVVKLRDGYERQNFRFNIDQTLTKWLRVSATNLFINRNVEPPSGVFYNVSRMEKDVDLFQENFDGQPYNLRANHFNGEVTNPLYALYKQKATRKTRRWMGNYSANIEFARWINLDLSQTIEVQNYRSENINPKDYLTSSGGTYGVAYTNGSINQSTDETSTYNTQFTFNLGHKFGDLDIKSKLSYLYENRHYEYNYLSASQFVISGIENFKNVASIASGNSSVEDERAQNYFAILGLDWKDRYLFDGMFRYDGSSLFGPDARWNPYYRVSGAYRISQDVTIPGIDELKIRVAHGTAGIRPRFDWQYEVYSLNNGVASASQKGNTALKPARTAETELGLNIDFLKKFNFEAVYAHSLTSDQFLSVPLIPFLNDGFSSQWQNAGTVKSNTLEMTLGANWVRKRDFSWTTNLVFSRVRQRITELPVSDYWLGDVSGVDQTPSGDQKMFRIREGETYGAIYGHRMVRTLEEMARQLPEGKTIADYQVNSEGYVIPAGTEGKITEMPVLYQEDGAVWTGKIGDGNPDFNMGITNTLAYKNFSLYVLLDWKQGGDIYNGNDQRLAFNLVSKRMDMTGVPEGQKKAYDYWAAGMYDANFANEYWVEDGTYLKLREVALGYTLPGKALSGFLNGTFKGITLKVVGRNLMTFTGYSGYDPEVGTVRQPVDGIGANPNYRNVAFSLGFNL